MQRSAHLSEDLLQAHGLTVKLLRRKNLFRSSWPRPWNESREIPL